MEWAILPLKRYAEFAGRSRRKEYWSFVLLTAIVFAILYFIEERLGLTMKGMGTLTLLFQLAILLPILAVGARRLHDIDRSGWWLVIFYGPALVMTVLPLLGIVNRRPMMTLLIASLIGLAVLIVFFVIEGSRGANRYGSDPKAAEGGAP
jgi:uncharacterized membrane protein YhaH (DUF805 family)